MDFLQQVEELKLDIIILGSETEEFLYVTNRPRGKFKANVSNGDIIHVTLLSTDLE